MSIERTLTQLQVNPRTAERAREIGQMGYMQWLGGMRCLRPIEISGAHMLTGIWQLRARARQGVPDELVCEDVSVV